MFKATSLHCADGFAGTKEQYLAWKTWLCYLKRFLGIKTKSHLYQNTNLCACRFKC